MIKSSRLSPRFYVGEEPGYEANVFGQSEFYILGAMGEKDPMHMFLLNSSLLEWCGTTGIGRYTQNKHSHNFHS